MDVSIIKKKIEKLDPKILGLTKIKINSFKKLGMGYSNLNYLVNISDKLFNCRINLDKGSSGNLKNEFNNLKLIEKLGISAKPYYLDNNFMLIDFIEGKIFPRNNKKYPITDIKNLAKTLSILHNSGLNSENVSKDQWIKHFLYIIKIINENTGNKHKEFFKNLLKIIKLKIQAIKNHPYCIIHGDLAPQNIINTVKEVKLIDLEDLQYSDPAEDIGQLIAQFGFNENFMKIFMDKYKTKDKNLLYRAKIMHKYLHFQIFYGN